MDSLSQIVLGAAVGEAALGKKVGNRAILWGAIAGTLPDMDVLLRFFVDEITATQWHRGFSHSILFCVLCAPLLGWIAKKIHKRLEEVSFKSWSWMFFWILLTHPLLDAQTTWGTQLFWPLEYKLAFQNIFVIDPLYTLPFLVMLIVAMFYKRTHPKRRLFNNLGLIISSSYLILSFGFKAMAHSAFKNALTDQKIEYVELDTKPTPLNTILWNAFVQTPNGYRIAYYSLFDGSPIHFSKEYSNNHDLLDPYKNQKVVQQLINISNGWYIVEKADNHLLFWDIRFGQAGIDPDQSPFIWCYQLTIAEDGLVSAKRKRPSFNNMSEQLKILFERIKGV